MREVRKISDRGRALIPDDRSNQYSPRFDVTHMTSYQPLHLSRRPRSSLSGVSHASHLTPPYRPSRLLLSQSGFLFIILCFSLPFE